ncbi:ankyrin repeat domain-containing protein [Puniceicoccaceae bacterium K14]|nr:ankyrin repeat domain-containing protein [Puniceicoccaceae bacterium K14]
MKVYPVFLLLFVSLTQFAASEVDLIYSVSGKEYLISSFEEGLPKLDDNSLDTGKSLNGTAGFGWNWRGALPVDLNYAWPIPFYEIHEASKKYGESEKTKTARLNIPGNLDFLPWSQEYLDNGLLVFGWVVGEEVVDIVVSSVNAAGRYEAGLKLNLERDIEEGYFLLWLVRDANLVKKTETLPYEWAAIDGNESISKISDALRSKDVFGNTALHFAALNGHVNIVTELLDRKAKRNRENNWGEIPLALAARNGRSDVAQLLYSEKAAIGSLAKNNSSCLSKAVGNGHFEVVKILAPKPPKSGIAKGEYSHSAVLAIRQGRENIAIYLLNHKAKVELTNKDKKESTIFSLFLSGYPSLAEVLIERFDGESIYDRKGHTIMHAIAPYSDIELLNKYKDIGLGVSVTNEKGLTPLDIAIAYSNLQAMCWFIENKEDNDLGANLVDPVHRAVGLGKEDSLHCLIDYGYNVNVVNDKGRNPLMEAVYIGNGKIVNSLIDAGAYWEVDHADFDECAALAIQMNEAAILESMISQGLSKDARLFNYWTLSYVAKFYQAEDVLSWTQDQGIPLESEDTLKSGDLDTPMKVKSIGKVGFSEEMQRKFGSTEADVTILVNKLGEICMSRYAVNTPKSIRSAVDRALFEGQYSPGIKNGEPVNTVTRFKIPLKVELKEDVVFELDELDEKPKSVFQRAPRFPYALKQNNVKGWVDLEWIIETDGSVRRVTVLRSSHSGFNQPSVESIKASRWKPGKLKGKAVASRVRQRITFNR